MIGPRWLLLACALCAGACAVTMDPLPAGSGGGGNSDDPAPILVTLGGTLVELGNRQPVAGAKIEIPLQPQIARVLSGADGKFLLTAPPRTRVQVRITMD